MKLFKLKGLKIRSLLKPVRFSFILETQIRIFSDRSTTSESSHTHNFNALKYHTDRAVVNIIHEIKSNHFYFHITTAHVSWRVKFLRACSRQCRKFLLIDSTYLQTYTDDNVQYTHTYTQYILCTIRHTIRHTIRNTCY